MSDNQILLDNNECLFDEREDRFARYGERRPRLLVQQMARTYGCGEAMLLPTRGAEDAIDLVIRSQCSFGDNVVVCGPTFDLFETRARLNSIDVINVERHFQQKGTQAEFRIDWPKLLERDFSRTKIVYLVHPNNPTAEPIAQNQVEELARRLGGHGIVLIDEAYIEFTYAPSMIDLIARHPNVVVIRTLSKSWGGADLRCGSIAADENVLRTITPCASVYPFSNLVLERACAILANPRVMKERVEAIKTRKKKLSTALRDLPAIDWMVESDAPFILASLKKEGGGPFLSDRDIKVRFGFKSARLGSAIRISIGTDRENQMLIEALRQFPY